MKSKFSLVKARRPSQKLRRFLVKPSAAKSLKASRFGFFLIKRHVQKISNRLVPRKTGDSRTKRRLLHRRSQWAYFMCFGQFHHIQKESVSSNSLE